MLQLIIWKQLLTARIYLLNYSKIFWVWLLAGIVLMACALTFSSPIGERVLYSDQATHVMTASSIWNDGDLKYSLEDLRRFREDYPKETFPRGLILKQGERGDLFFAKPYVYGLLAAPFYAMLGVDGFVVFNVFCLVLIGIVAGMALIGVLGRGWSLFTSFAFVVPSAFLPWVFVAHPDLFIAALLAVGGYLLMRQKTTRRCQIIAALLLGVSLHEKITFFASIPFIILAMPSVDWRRRVLICFVVVLSWFLLTSVNLVIDGSFLSYQGLRFGVHAAPFPLEKGWIPPTRGGVEHVFDPIAVLLAIVGNLSLLPEKFIDFFVGRQTGIIPYFALAFGLLVVRSTLVWGRSAVVLLGFFAYLILHWLVFPTNGYGGSGSYGSRYMMQALPLIPISFIGVTPRSYWSKSLSAVSIRFFLVGLTAFAFVVQQRIFIHGQEAVMRYVEANVSAPLNAFRLEKWLLRSTLGLSSPYVDETENGRFRIYKPDETNRGSWSRIGVSPANSSFILFKDNAQDKFPPVSLLLPVDGKIRILNGGRVVWKGMVAAAQPQTIEIDGLVHFRSAYDLLYKRHIALTELILEAEVTGASIDERRLPALLRFDAPRPLPFEAIGERLTVAEFVDRGADLRTGWSQLEPWGVWSDGNFADIYLRVGEGRQKFLVELSAHAYVPIGRQALEVEFLCPGANPRQELFEQGLTKSVELLCEKSRYHEYLQITAVIRNPTSPLTEGQGNDSRRLGIGLKTVKIKRVE